MNSGEEATRNMGEDTPSESLHDYCLKLGLQLRGDNNDNTKMAVASSSVAAEKTAKGTSHPIPPVHTKVKAGPKNVQKNVPKNNFDCKNCGKGFANSRQFLKHKCSTYSTPESLLKKPKGKAISKKRSGKSNKAAKTVVGAKKVKKGAEQSEETAGTTPKSTGEAQVDEETQSAVVHLADHTYIRDDLEGDVTEGASSLNPENNSLKETEGNHVQCEFYRMLPQAEQVPGNESLSQKLPCEKLKELATSLSDAPKSKPPLDGEGSSGENPKSRSKRKCVFKKEADSCPHCKKGFYSEKHFERHVKICGSNLVCEFCGKDFNSYSRKHAYSVYELHYYTHVDEKPYPCMVCSQGFVRKIDLDKHNVIHTTEYIPQTCLQCGAIFSSAELLEKHVKKHDRPMWTCSKCEQRFVRQVIYEKHVLVCQTEVSCEVCGKVFQCLSKNRKSRYQEHMFTHTGEKPYKCQFCERAFRDRSTRKKHERSHTGEKPYPCTLCQRAFSQLGLLRNHVRTHTGEKPFQCNLCELAFAKQCNLKDHMRVHTKEKPYSCQLCNKSFTQSGTYHKHMRRHNQAAGNTAATAGNDAAAAGNNEATAGNDEVTAGNDADAAGNTPYTSNKPTTSNGQDNSEVNPEMETLENSASTQVIQEIPVSSDEITIIVSEGGVSVNGETTSLSTIDVEQISSLLASCS